VECRPAARGVAWAGWHIFGASLKKVYSPYVIEKAFLEVRTQPLAAYYRLQRPGVIPSRLHRGDELGDYLLPLAL